MLSIRNLSVFYGEHIIIQNLSEVFPDQGSIALLGPSGIGKTTLIRVLGGLLKPTVGELASSYQRPAYIFQEPRLFAWLTAVENVAVVCKSKEKATELLRILLPQESDLSKYPYELSGGMKQRVSIARALAYEPDILFMDEPFKGLDEETRSFCAEFVFSRMKDKTVFMITHDTQELSYCNTVYRIQKSPITQLILEKSNTPVRE